MNILKYMNGRIQARERFLKIVCIFRKMEEQRVKEELRKFT